MSDALDVDLRDEEMVDEIRLVTELMVMASMTPGELDQDVIDRTLGVTRSPQEFPAQRSTDESPAQELQDLASPTA
jgi:hypothetical protein